MKILIDGDIIVYRAACAAQHKDKETGVVTVEPEAFAIHNAEQMLIKIVKNLKGNFDNVQIAITASNDLTNFRKALYPKYKANRESIPRPDHYYTLRYYLMRELKAISVNFIEADDFLCMNQYRICGRDFHPLQPESIIVSIDKDLDQVPGWHYNFVHDRIYYQTPIQGLRCFYKQILVGDAADNIPRIKERWRSKIAFGQLDLASTEAEMVNAVTDVVKQLYADTLSPQAQRELIESRGRLLWLKRHEEDTWRLPV